MPAKRGVTFVEILTSLAILGILITGLLSVFLLCFQWNDASRETLIVITQIQNKLEEIRARAYDDIPAAYSQSGNPGNIFAINGVNGIGSVIINTIEVDAPGTPGRALLLSARATACWRGSRNNRLFGEDANLNGILDPGEDANANGMLDSQASLTALIARR